MKKRIGVFDSGFGGLDVFREIVRSLPEYDYTYLADTARAPYGSLSPEAVYEYTKQAVDFLFANDCSLIIFACNTASSDALHTIQEEYLARGNEDRKILGVLIPAAEEAVHVTKNKRIGVIGTEGTVASGAFPRELSKLAQDVQVFQSACPLLVPLIEAGEHHKQIVEPLLRQYLDPLLREGIDTLILGCTHYGFLKDDIRDVIGPAVRIVSETDIVPQKLKQYLEKHHGLRDRLSTDNTLRFCTTDPTARFGTLGSQFFGRTISPERVSLESRP